MNLATVQSIRIAPSACAAAATRTVDLRAGQVLSLTKSDGVQRLEIRSGMVWITATPADGDTLLRRGDRMTLPPRWPFILQAMNDTQLTLAANPG